ncbi:hypothetical protein [Yersinia massiliensis]|uniref:Uncharacterized protein n=1 Tax=Yersinia massiliensis TaxID=419257 RepID=A0ABM6V069_9GAMM|nr:hypothetical protein [Yersinia massiliensis]AVX40641.1 hypothetical protein DA391_23485 [Yersinia massiliensis]HDM8093286.1 hypothetical protein [Yersinia enterocolitica]
MKSIKMIGTIHILAAIFTIASLFTIYYYFDSRGHSGITYFSVTSLIAISLWTVLYFLRKSISNGIATIVANNTNSNFSPDKNLTFIDINNGKYVGIDSNSKAMLIVSLNNKEFANGFIAEFDEWKGYELEDCNLTLKFNNIKRPTFNINSNAKIKVFCHKLDNLLSSTYRPLVTN